MDPVPLFQTTLAAVGADAAELIADGILILFDRTAPAELAEVSVLHEAAGPPGRAPVSGDWLCIGPERVRITAVGDTAWSKVRDIGHVVFSFSGAAAASRAGEICVDPMEPARLLPLLRPGAVLAVRSAEAPA